MLTTSDSQHKFLAKWDGEKGTVQVVGFLFETVIPCEDKPKDFEIEVLFPGSNTLTLEITTKSEKIILDRETGEILARKDLT